MSDKSFENMPILATARKTNFPLYKTKLLIMILIMILYFLYFKTIITLTYTF